LQVSNGAPPETVAFEYTGPGTLAGTLLRAFWQPVARAEDLAAGRALPITVMGENLALYRGEDGVARLVASRCPHRGTQLSVGWVEGEAIRCRYHGWKFDGTGQCIEQPDEPAAFAQKVALRSYPVIEYIGLTFAYLGEGEPPPFRRFPAFEGEGFIKVGLTEIWPCNFFNRCENTVDIVHVNWVHRGTARRLNLEHQMLHCTPTLAEETDYGIDHAYRFSDGRIEHTEFHMPNVSHVRPAGRVEGAQGDVTKISLDRLFFYVPIDDENSMTFVVDFVPLTGEAADAYRERAMRDRRAMTMSASDFGAAILAGTKTFDDISPEISSYYSFWIEDYVTLVGQGAIPDRSQDRLGRTDIGPILLRKLWRRELKALAAHEPIKRWA
jgi:5,5'-dehydrodivanillate O-demethylase oxygenase subunit